ncbi:MAG: hypothetical protein AABZ61_00050 [Bacteroidota bacterium]
MNENWPLEGNRLKLMMFDFNWAKHVHPHEHTGPTAPQDWAFVDPREYFEWHVNFGNNAVFLHAYTHTGYAFYPTKLGAVAPGPGQDLLPRVFEMTRKAKMPFWSYFCVSCDIITNQVRRDWLVPGSEGNLLGFLAPESPWTDLLCARMEEFLSEFPVDALLMDWFCYGELDTSYAVQPAWFVEKPFERIIGRRMPEKAESITPEESFKYKREVLAHQFYRLRDVARRVSPQTKLIFTPPYMRPADPFWVDSPMVNESDGLLAEFSKPEIMDWLLTIRKPHQCVIATPMASGVELSAETMKELYAKGCGLNGYFWGTPPNFMPHPSFRKHLEAVSKTFKELP